VPIAAFTQNYITLLLACFKVKSPVSGVKTVFGFMWNRWTWMWQHFGCCTLFQWPM